MNDYRESYAGKTVLVTGGAGAIGSNLSRELVSLGARVLILDDLSSSQRWNVPSCQGVLFTQGDILDEVKLKRVFFERPQIVYHFAAFFANQNSLDHPERDLMVNGMGTLRLLEYSLLSGIDRFVFASSGCTVYDGAAPLPLKEDYVSMNLTTPYQVTKMLGELYCNLFYNHYGLKVTKTRFFNNYGPGEIPGQYRNVVPNFIYYAMKGLPLPITGDGGETRDFTYVTDTVDGLLRAGFVEAAIGKEFNIATNRETRIGDLARTINDLVGNQAGVQSASRRKWDTHHRRLASIDRAKELLGYNPQTPLEVGLRHTIAWFVENWDKIDTSASFAPGMSSAVREMVVNQDEENTVSTQGPRSTSSSLNGLKSRKAFAAKSGA
jgi:nucleoside-diphosphate-sugar epimerase